MHLSFGRPIRKIRVSLSIREPHGSYFITKSIAKGLNASAAAAAAAGGTHIKNGNP